MLYCLLTYEASRPAGPTMNDNLRKLIRLQDVMTAISELQEKINAVPAEVARLEKELLAFQTEVEKEKAALSDLQKERRRLEMELMGVESRIQKYQGQLAEVKTNKEYQAMLHEIEGCREERAKLDEKILLDMEEAEKTQAAAKVHDDRLRARRQETERGKEALRQKTAGLEAEKKRLETERDGIQSGVPATLLDPFLKVSKQRKGLGLVPVREELCGGCHVRVMPKLIQEIRRSASLITCDSCKRFLYVYEDLHQTGSETSPGVPGQGPGGSGPGRSGGGPAGQGPGGPIAASPAESVS